ncbi:MAG TPA: nicotinate-nucleotide--dimethylbenzimidazole phosphoribosyltransferase [Fibrobacteria bacterium]|nr:nicotinate-nucleotide--dimethylbenzimidazole phosphoribosyltransferase [Fibrobacteria bacterium]
MIDRIAPERFEAVRARQDQLLKIKGSLGDLEEIGNRIGAIQRTDRPSLGRGAVVVCCGDHGVTAEGVAPNPDSITRIQVFNFLEGGAAINQIAATSDAEVWVVNAGVKGGEIPPHPRLVGPCVREGAGNIAREPAMTREQALAAIELGRTGARKAVESGAEILAAGDMGIGNTTPSAALTSALLKLDAELVTGRGAGVDDPARARKVKVVESSVARARQVLGDLQKVDPVDVLAQIGSLEIAAIAGVYLEGAKLGVPLVADGFPVTTGVMVAVRIDPGVKDYLFAGHQSMEPGHAWQLRDLGLEPIFRLGLRLGEGTGAVLAFPVLRASCQILAGMKTFADIGMG